MLFVTVMPPRLKDRTCPLGRILAVPPPRSETVRPGGVWLAVPLLAIALGRALVLGRAAVLVRPAVLGRAALGREAVFVRPAGVDRFVVLGRLAVDGREFVFVCPAVVCEGVVVCDCVAA